MFNEINETNEPEENNVKVIIPVKCSRNLMIKLDYISNLDTEVAGWLVGEVKTNFIYLDDVLIPKQEVSSSSVEIDTSSGAILLKEFGARCKKIIGHIHGHAGMSVFWSSTDEENMKQIIEPRKFFIFVVSSRGEHMVRIESKKPFKMIVDNLGLEVYDPDEEKIRAKLEIELGKKVTEKTYEPANSSATYYPSKNKEGQRDLGNLPLKGGKDFELEIADNVIAEYSDRLLTIKGLDYYTAGIVVDAFPDLKSELSGEFYNKYLSFKLKRKKARKMLPLIQDIIDESYAQNYQSLPYYNKNE